MRTLLITDLHLNSRIPGLLKAQKESILKIFKDEEPDEVIIMGDVFMYRKPSPSELLAFKYVSDYMKKKTSTIYVLRGNHDSETKADDGITSLSLFDEEFKWTGSGIHVIVHSWVDEARKRVFIPHYENENTIIDALEMVPEDYTVFGHFGYDGALIPLVMLTLVSLLLTLSLVLFWGISIILVRDREDYKNLIQQ
jgi:DNA repair exonuclease SbcCD nuclease subunit